MKDNEAELFVQLLERQSSESIEIQTTHISYIFFQGDRVYKVKKTLKTDFLDYSKVELRQKNCLAELRLNRRLAPHIYLSVRPLFIDKDHRFCWKEDGDVADWVVEMLRLPHEKMLDQLLLEVNPVEADLTPVADLLSAFYRSQKVVIHDIGGFWLQLFKRCQENFLFLPRRWFTDQMINQLELIKAAQLSFLFTQYKTFVQRSKFIVDGHGDLRPEHVCLTNPPVIFDCVEFSAAFRIVDIIDDLAFFKLECQVAQRSEIGDYLLKHIAEAGDYPPMLLSFYLSYRALVRVKVEALKVEQGSEVSLEKCKRYLEAGYKQALPLRRPILLVVGGLSGSGKTTVAALIAGMLGAKHLQSDQVRAELFSQEESTPSVYNQGRYLPERRDVVYRYIMRQARRLIKQGQSVVIDASFIAVRHRLLVKTMLLSNRDLRSAGIWCVCADQLAIRRLMHRSVLGDGYSEAGPEIYWQQKNALEKIGKDDIFRHQIDTDLDLKALEKKLLGMLRKQLST